MPTSTTHHDLRARATRRRGVVLPGTIARGHHAEVVRGKSIRLFGQDPDNGPQADYDRLFSVGDEAEYDSYNLHYIGRIVSIGAKTVTIAHGKDLQHRRRLSLYEFSFRNRRFDATEFRQRNAAEMECI